MELTKQAQCLSTTAQAHSPLGKQWTPTLWPVCASKHQCPAHQTCPATVGQTQGLLLWEGLEVTTVFQSEEGEFGGASFTNS